MEGLGVWAMRSAGMSARAKCHIDMPEELSQSSAKTPPSALLKPYPKDLSQGHIKSQLTHEKELRCKPCVCVLDAAACVRILGAVTVGPKDLASKVIGTTIGLCNRAALARATMKRHLVCSLVIHALNNIDFTRRGPIRANGPETRPRRTADRHIRSINDKETAVVALLRCDTNTTLGMNTHKS